MSAGRAPGSSRSGRAVVAALVLMFGAIAVFGLLVLGFAMAYAGVPIVVLVGGGAVTLAFASVAARTAARAQRTKAGLSG